LRARTRDLCIVPIANRGDGQRTVAEDVIFGSGRPVLVFQPGQAELPARELGTVVVGWDGSRCAARAVGDALPVLVRAREVCVFSALHEKPDARPAIGLDLVRHLKGHGINAFAEEVDAANQGIGAVLDACVARHKADLLVMGAYGRPRIREFILGGATEHVLARPRVPLLMSH
jgi:nucleotide-binding universal stress UspA family protein